jgi:hypothetical protein
MFVSMHIAYFIALYTSQSFSQHKLRKTPCSGLLVCKEDNRPSWEGTVSHNISRKKGILTLSIKKG